MKLETVIRKKKIYDITLYKKIKQNIGGKKMKISGVMINTEFLDKKELQAILDIIYKNGTMSVTCFPNKKIMEEHIKKIGGEKDEN